jgi:hypothetical protein
VIQSVTVLNVIKTNTSLYLNIPCLYTLDYACTRNRGQERSEVSRLWERRTNGGRLTTDEIAGDKSYRSRTASRWASCTASAGCALHAGSGAGSECGESLSDDGAIPSIRLRRCACCVKCKAGHALPLSCSCLLSLFLPSMPLACASFTQARATDLRTVTSPFAIPRPNYSYPPPESVLTSSMPWIDLCCDGKWIYYWTTAFSWFNYHLWRGNWVWEIRVLAEMMSSTPVRAWRRDEKNGFLYFVILSFKYSRMKCCKVGRHKICLVHSQNMPWFTTPKVGLIWPA